MENLKISKTERIIQKKCGKDILLHSKRVGEIALILREIYGGNQDVITLSSLLHDIAIKDSFATHAKKGSKIIKEMFGNKWNDVLLTQVCYCVEHHSITSQQPKKLTPELICVYDADKIDFLLSTDAKNPLWDVVSKSFLGEKSFTIYESLRRIIKCYQKIK